MRPPWHAFRVGALVGYGALASLDASAHGGSIPAWVAPAVLIAFGGIVACLVVPLFVGTAPLLARFGIGLALAVGTFVLWYALISVFAKFSNGLSMSDPAGAIGIGTLALAPWTGPVVLVVRALFRNKR